LLNIEFNVNDLIKKGIIESAFPMHEFRTKKNIIESFKQNWWSILFTPLKHKLKVKDLKPYNSIAFYFGCEIALYVSFLINLTSYLLILSLIGTAVFIIGIYLDPTFHPLLEIIYCLGIMSWMILMMFRWEYKESIHSY